MLAAYPHTQASPYMIKQDDLLLPGYYDLEILLLLSDILEDYPVVGFTGLMAAIIAQAGLDVLSGDLEAAEWLKSDQCFDYCYALGYEHKHILDWLKRRKLTQ